MQYVALHLMTLGGSMFARTQRWATVGLDPLPILSPPYRGLDTPPGHVWLSGYDDWQINRLDGRWTHDITQVTVGDGSIPCGGDVIVWVGDLKYMDGHVSRVVYQPSRILAVGPRRKGRVWIESLRDNWIREIHLEDALTHRPFLHESLTAAWAGQLVHTKPSVLDMWGLHLWCPECGHLGAPTVVSLSSTSLVEARDRNGNLQPWPWGSMIPTECITARPSSSMRCTRCDAQWGEHAIAEPMVWPSFAEKDDDPFIIDSVDDLLEGYSERYLHGEPIKSLEELGQWMSMQLDDFDLDFPPEDWFSSEGITIRVWNFGLTMPFPFALTELLWEAEELESQATSHMEAAEMEE